MRAAVYLGAGRLELQDWPEPRVGSGERLLRLRGCGLCGSDIAKVAHDTAIPPAVLGHEVVGDVVEVASPRPSTLMRRQEAVKVYATP